MKSISVLYTILLLTATNGVFAQHQNVTVSSPDKRIALNIFTAGKKLVYTIKAGNIPIINTSSLGLLVDSVDIGDNILMMGTPKTSKINEDYAIIGNHTTAHNRANEAEISLSSAGKKFSLIVRVYNDGVAVRYTIPPNTKHIDAERTAWTLPDHVNKIAWADYSQSYEGVNYVTPVEKVPEGKTIMAPVTFETSGYYVSVTEAD